MSLKIEPIVYKLSTLAGVEFQTVASQLDIRVVDIAKTKLGDTAKNFVGVQIASNPVVYYRLNDYGQVITEVYRKGLALKFEIIQKALAEISIMTNETEQENKLAELLEKSQISPLEREKQDSEVQNIITKIDALRKFLTRNNGKKLGGDATLSKKEGTEKSALEYSEDNKKEKEAQFKTQDSNSGKTMQVNVSSTIDKRILSNPFLKEYHRFFETHFYGRYSASVGIFGGHLQDSVQYASDKVFKGLQAATGSLPGVSLATSCVATTVISVNDTSKTKKAISLGSAFRAVVFNNTCTIWAEGVTLARSEEIIKSGEAKLPLESLQKTSHFVCSCPENIKDVAAQVLAKAADTTVKRMAFEDVEKIIRAIEEGNLKEESSITDLVTILRNETTPKVTNSAVTSTATKKSGSFFSCGPSEDY